MTQLKYLGFVAAVLIFTGASHASSVDVIRFTPPAANEWMVLTDKTERSNGATMAAVSDVPNTAVFSGSLEALPGETGPVAFAIARVPLAVGSQTDGIQLELSSVEELVVSLIVTTKISQTAPSGAIVTYQYRLHPNSQRQVFAARWMDFEAYARGRKILGQPPLSATNIATFGIQLTRSSQTPQNQQRIPLPFEFSIYR